MGFKGTTKQEKKQAYDTKMCDLLEEFNQVLICAADNVGSNQLQGIRKGLRPESVVLMGKKTMMKRTIRTHSEKTGNEAILNLIPLLVGNVGLIFTKGDLKEVGAEVSSTRWEHLPVWVLWHPSMWWFLRGTLGWIPPRLPSSRCSTSPPRSTREVWKSQPRWSLSRKATRSGLLRQLCWLNWPSVPSRTGLWFGASTTMGWWRWIRASSQRLPLRWRQLQLQQQPRRKNWRIRSLPKNRTRTWASACSIRF